MEINPEILKLLREREKFRKNYDFSQHSIKDIEKTIGKKLTDKLLDLFYKSEDSAIIFFYSPSVAMGGKIPNEHYETKPIEVENLINNYSVGNIFS